MESLEGTNHASSSLWYLTTHRDVSLREMMLKHSQHESVAQHIFTFMLAVQNLHQMGFVHRNLRPEVVY
jgi:serine/threonine protein kinase